MKEKRLGIATRKMEGLVPSQISVKGRRQTKVSKCYLCEAVSKLMRIVLAQ